MVNLNYLSYNHILLWANSHKYVFQKQIISNNAQAYSNWSLLVLALVFLVWQTCKQFKYQIRFFQTQSLSHSLQVMKHKLTNHNMQRGAGTKKVHNPFEMWDNELMLSPFVVLHTHGVGPGHHNIKTRGLQWVWK